MIGIYKITNNINKKVYVGQSIHIEKRWTQHKSPLEQERFSDKPLYKAFKEYGIENFTFEVIEECKPEELNEKEIYWISKLNSMVHYDGYNITAGGDGNVGESHPGHIFTEEDVKDIRRRYANHERCKKVECLYKNKIGHSGFSKVWKGETWIHIMPEVYTPENKYFHLHNTGNKGDTNGRSKLTADDVKAIRLRKKNGETREKVYEDYKYTGISFGSFSNVWFYMNWKDIIV